MKKLFVFILLVIAMTGCTTVAQQAIAGYETTAIKSVQSIEDNNLRMLTTNLCATPFSAAIRNPAIIPAMKALCLPGGDATNPSLLFETMPLPK